jgi:hypothetical protein
MFCFIMCYIQPILMNGAKCGSGREEQSPVPFDGLLEVSSSADTSACYVIVCRLSCTTRLPGRDTAEIRSVSFDD